MLTNNNDVVYKFLSSFLSIFHARINDCSWGDGKIEGTLKWDDSDEFQKFSWIIRPEKELLNESRKLCEILTKFNLISGDKILILENELKHRLIQEGWSPEDAGKTIDYLCSIEVKMIDDGEETDSFFVHF